MRLTLLTLCLSTVAAAQLPPQATAILSTLPGGKLSLPYVVKRAMGASDSYRALKAEQEGADVSSLKVSALFNPRLFAKAGFQDDKREPQIVFSPQRITGTQYSLGVSQLFSTGTALEFELSHGLSQLEFLTIPNTSFAETKATLGLRQSLWKDAFGAGTRAAVRAGEEASEASRAAFREGRAGWLLQLADLYYYSWLSQSQYQAAKQSVARRQRLLGIMKIRVQRGTAEKPDLLQVDAARANSEVGLEQARQAMGDRWRLLVIALKLPAAVAEIDPALIPLGLDTPEKAVGEQCQKQPTPGKPSPALLKARAMKSSAQAALERAEADKRPSLDLLVNLGANSIAPNSGDTLSDFVAARHPLMGVALNFSLPLGFDAAESERLAASTQFQRAEAGLSLEEDTWRVQWRNGCLELARLVSARTLLSKALEAQTERENLEEARFRLGRSTTLQVIQAGDDVTAAQQSLWATEAQLRLAAWRLQVLSGAADDFLDSLEQEKPQ